MHFIESLYEKHKSELTRYLRKQWHKSAEEAADIIQQTFVRLMSGGYSHCIKDPRAYLYRVVKNCCIDSLRQDKRNAAYRRETEAMQDRDVATVLSVEEIFLNTEQLQRLQKIIAALPGKRRQVFILNRVYQLSYKEIAKHMGMSTAGVKKHIVRAQATCRKRLG